MTGKDGKARQGFSIPLFRVCQMSLLIPDPLESSTWHMRPVRAYGRFPVWKLSFFRLPASPWLYCKGQTPKIRRETAAGEVTEVKEVM
jgi:hypothetical protein